MLKRYISEEYYFVEDIFKYYSKLWYLSQMFSIYAGELWINDQKPVRGLDQCCLRKRQAFTSLQKHMLDTFLPTGKVRCLTTITLNYTEVKFSSEFTFLTNKDHIRKAIRVFWLFFLFYINVFAITTKTLLHSSFILSKLTRNEDLFHKWNDLTACMMSD